MATFFDYGAAGSNLGSRLAGAFGARQDAETRMGRELAQEAAYMGKARESQAKVDEINQRRQFQTPEFSSRIAAQLAGLNDDQAGTLETFQKSGSWGETPAITLPEDQAGPTMPAMPKDRPDWATPQAMNRYNLGKAAHLANLGATGDSNVAQFADAFAKLLGQGRIDDAMARPDTIPNFGAAMAASEGKPLYHSGANGVVQNFTGSETLNDIGRSAAAENAAQARNAESSAALNRVKMDTERADASLKRSKIGQPQYIVGPDGQAVQVSGPPTKPMPAAALKMQQEEIDALSTAAGMNDQLAHFSQLIQTGDLNLGPVENMESRARNFASKSTKNSKNYQSFMATLEKLRNDSLRLNKGVQTDGDAQRAWNELLTNINDPEVVKQRLDEIQAINDRAMTIREMNITNIRGNYGNPPMDLSGYRPAKGGGTPHSKPPALASVPDGAIAHLKANPQLAGAFAAKYGKAATDAVLGMK